MKNFAVKSLQFIIFVPPFSPSNKIAFVNDFVIKTDNVFTHEPQILSLPKEAPPEIPRIVLRNDDQTYQVNFSINRITFLYQDALNRNSDFEGIYPNYRFNLSKVVHSLKGMTNLPFIRFGFVLNLLYEISESMNQYLSERYFKDNPFPDAHEIQLNVHHVFKMEEFSVNRWIKYRTLRKREAQEQDTGLGIEIDINSLADQNLNAGMNEALSFFMASKTYIEKGLTNFPFFDFSSPKD